MTRAPNRRPGFGLALLLYPFVAAAVAINLFMLGLVARTVQLPTISPLAALIIALPLAIPFTWFAARWVRGLITEAERTPGSR